MNRIDFVKNEFVDIISKDYLVSDVVFVSKNKYNSTLVEITNDLYGPYLSSIDNVFVSFELNLELRSYKELAFNSSLSKYMVYNYTVSIVGGEDFWLAIYEAL
jgi:hypothetical protein